MSKVARRLLRDTSGATAVEYGLMVALIALVILLAVSLLGGSLVGLFEDPELTGALN
jgi:pilus assembly protein Flp/PilA